MTDSKKIKSNLKTSFDKLLKVDYSQFSQEDLAEITSELEELEKEIKDAQKIKVQAN